MIVVANYEHRLLAFLVDLILSFLVCVALFVFIPLLRNYSYIIELFTIILFFILGIYVILSYIC
ncbi:MAG: hypothetical protein LBM99_05200, partial [Bacillales bacterium]|nr:hypothetical protein [Bacillales bacterium]